MSRLLAVYWAGLFVVCRRQRNINSFCFLPSPTVWVWAHVCAWARVCVCECEFACHRVPFVCPHSHPIIRSTFQLLVKGQKKQKSWGLHQSCQPHCRVLHTVLSHRPARMTPNLLLTLLLCLSRPTSAFLQHAGAATMGWWKYRKWQTNPRQNCSSCDTSTVATSEMYQKNVTFHFRRTCTKGNCLLQVCQG